MYLAHIQGDWYGVLGSRRVHAYMLSPPDILLPIPTHQAHDTHPRELCHLIPNHLDYCWCLDIKTRPNLQHTSSPRAVSCPAPLTSRGREPSGVLLHGVRSHRHARLMNHVLQFLEHRAESTATH